MYALVGVVEHLPVHPLVVQRQGQGLAHAQVLQQRAAGVEHIALKACWQLVGKLALHQLASLEFFAIDAPRPVARTEKAHQIKLTSLQRLQPRGAVFVNLDVNARKVVLAAAHIQIARPVLRIQHVGDVFAKVHRANAVGAAANGRVGDHLIEGLALT